MSKKSKIFQRGLAMILVKNSNFLHCLFLLKIGPKKVFGGVLDNKNMSFTCPKNRKFSKGVNA